MLYGSAPKNAPDELRFFPRQALHAGLLGFVHPKTNEKMTFMADLPQDLIQLKDNLEKLNLR